MASERITQLEEFYDEDPHDPFNLYALALEYLKYDPEKSRELFERLLNHHKEYLPTYYHAAKLYQELGEKEKATNVFVTGISLARKLNDTKAMRELQSAYDEFMY
jgi:Tfp pilus assembly protein PilF